jgi:predicted  nucleic acid-binding Zn-ribbon protein
MPATKDTDTKEQMRALIRLQHMDNRLDQITKLQGDLPEEIQDLEDERAGLKTRLENFKEESKQQEVSKRQAKTDIKEAEQLIDKYQDQQMEVRNNREYDALTKEIEAQEERIEEAEETIEEVEESAEERQEAIEEAEERLDSLDDLIEEKRGDLDEVMEDTKQEEDRLHDARQEAEEAVQERYLRAYKRLRERMRDGRAVVPLERGAAAGFAVPPQRQVEIRQQNRIIVCEHTGRVIVDGDLYEETIAEMEEN